MPSHATTYFTAFAAAPCMSRVSARGTAARMLLDVGMGRWNRVTVQVRRVGRVQNRAAVVCVTGARASPEDAWHVEQGGAFEAEVGAKQEPGVVVGGSGVTGVERLQGGGGGAGGVHGGDGGKGWGEEEGEGDAGEEVAVVLRRAGRGWDSLPAVARGASVEEVRRLLEVEAMPVLGWLARRCDGLRDRMVANRRFVMQMGVELGVGFVTKTLAEVKGRGERFWREFDFYVSDIMLELVGDAMVVWLLSPVAGWARGGGGWVARLPRHAGQVGRFGVAERVGGFLWKGVQFGGVGFVSSMIGHGATLGLVNLRGEKKGEADGEGAVKLAPVVPTSLAWGAFLASSTNLRYQMVNGVEERVLGRLLGGNAIGMTVTTTALRFGNCFVGGLHWLPFAKAFGLQ